MSVEKRVSNLERESAVMDERTKNLGKHVVSISDSVKTMQKWIMGFIISCALMVFGTMFKYHLSGTVVTASPIQVQEVKK